jgi:uncharacterized damage-inducible protein DinB
MPVIDALLPEFDNEMANTRRALERIPDEKFDFRPHPKSNTMRWLASHIANIPTWAKMTMESDSFDVQPPAGAATGQTPQASSREELLAVFDKNVAASRAALAASSDQAMFSPWSLLKGGQTIFTMPRVAVLRGMIMNHLIHHRGQLTVYLRLNDIPVPALYGPSADEGF